MNKYKLIYADPPWSYNRKTKKQDVTYVYNDMKLEDIKNMGAWIKSLRDKNSVLFLWATSPKLPEALDVMKAWGYNYKTSIVWNKIRPYIGYYVNPIHEICLIGGYGSSTPEVSSKERNQILSIFAEKKRKHSQKPERMYEIIETLYPTYNKIELFARNKRKGWDVWNPTEEYYLNKEQE